MIATDWPRRLAAASLVVFGSWVWASRLDFAPKDIITSRFGNRLVDIDSDVTTDLNKVCRGVENPDGWILFMLETNLISDAQFRTYFETDKEPLGLFVESEPELLRLGLGLGPGPQSDLQIPIRVIRKNVREVFIIAVSRDETRVLANAIDRTANWPGYLADEWLCTQTQVGSDTRELSQGFRCSGCDTKVQYVVGSRPDELATVLAQLSNYQNFRLRRVSGTILSLLGLALFSSLGKRVFGQFGRFSTTKDSTGPEAS